MFFGCFLGTENGAGSQADVDFPAWLTLSTCGAVLKLWQILCKLAIPQGASTSNSLLCPLVLETSVLYEWPTGTNLELAVKQVAFVQLQETGNRFWSYGYSIKEESRVLELCALRVMHIATVVGPHVGIALQSRLRGFVC